MLHRFIDKQLKISTKRKSIGTPSSFLDKNDHMDMLLSSPKLFPREKEQRDSIISPLMRRSSINSQDFSNMLSNMSNFVVNLDAKNQRIWELEAKIASISELIFGLYEKIKESLLVDEQYDAELKRILFNDDLLGKIKDNDPKFSIELLKSVVETSLNLREFLRENYRQKPETIEKTGKSLEENQQDYLMLIHKCEIEIKDRKNAEMHLKLLHESTKSVISYYESQNKFLLGEIKRIFSDFKHDYLKLLEIVKEREREIGILDEDLKKKRENIFSLQEKLLSINVLEKKINVLDDKYQKDVAKLKGEYDSNLKKHFASVQKDPIFTHKLKEKQEEIQNLELKFARINSDKSRIVEQYERKLLNLQKNNRSLLIKNLDISKQLIEKEGVNADGQKNTYLKAKKSQIQMKNIVSAKDFKGNNPKKLLNNFLATTEVSVSMSPSFKKRTLTSPKKSVFINNFE